MSPLFWRLGRRACWFLVRLWACRYGRCRWRRRRCRRLPASCPSFPSRSGGLPRYTTSHRVLTRISFTSRPFSTPPRSLLAPISPPASLYTRLVLRAATDTSVALGQPPRYFHVVQRIDRTHIDVVGRRKRRRFARSSLFPVVLTTTVATTVSTTPASSSATLFAAARGRGRRGRRAARGGRSGTSRPAKVRGVAVVAATLATRTALFLRAFGRVPSPPFPLRLSLSPRVVIYLRVRIARNVHMLRSEEHSD